MEPQKPIHILAPDTDPSIVLDLVRWVAAQAVCVGHAISFFGVAPGWRAPAAPYMQNLAVIVFFVLSGFFIAHALIRSARNQHHGLGIYLIDRVARIFSGLLPALLVILLVDTLLIRASLHQQPTYVSVRAFFGTLAMLQNYPSPWGGSLEIPSFGSAGHLWSLAVEFHIYLFVGGFYYLLQGGRGWLAGGVIAALTFAVPLAYFSPDVTSTPGAGLSWLWLLGFCAYFLTCYRIPKTTTIRIVYLFAATALLIMWWHSSTPGHEYRLTSYFLLGLGFVFGLIGLNGSRVLLVFPKIRRIAPLLAGYSYSLYLLHHTIIYALHAIAPDAGLVGAWLSILASNLLSFLLARLTEFHHRAIGMWLKRRMQWES